MGFAVDHWVMASCQGMKGGKPYTLETNFIPSLVAPKGIFCEILILISRERDSKNLIFTSILSASRKVCDN